MRLERPDIGALMRLIPTALEVPVMNVLGSFGTGHPPISSEENGRFVILIQYVVVNSPALGLDKVLTPHNWWDCIIDPNELAFH